jgi:beta-ribofuranosylaminobenzene 5'-phosphate synthase
MIRVTSPSRIHISLLDMNGSLGRVDGGVGLALRTPSTVVEVRKGEGYPGELDYLIKMLPFRKGFSVSVKRRIPAHVGLGSETQLRLSVAAALHEFFGRKWNIEKLARMVHRGGTSGIGVGAFRNGGFILDGGHYFGCGQEKDSFLPSRASKAMPAPIIASLPFPNWDIVLAIPDAGKGLSGESEKAFFEMHCPIPEREVEKISRIVLAQMLPAVVLHDIRMFGTGIDAVKRLGFKSREIEIQPDVVHNLIHDFEKVGYGVSVSSFGPTVFAFSDNREKTEEMKKIFHQNYKGTFIKTKAQNRGAKIERL